MALNARHVEQAQRALHEGATARLVRRARITLIDRDDEFRARSAIEDALRTADFSDCGRLIVVRSLRLTGLSPKAGGPEIAAAMEAAWRQVAPYAVHFASPDADRAPAVFFPSIHGARLAWLGRVATGEPVEAWFWNRAVPEVAAAPMLDDAVSRVLLALATAAPAELAAVIHEWSAQQVRQVFALLKIDVATLVLARATNASVPAGVHSQPTSEAAAGTAGGSAGTLRARVVATAAMVERVKALALPFHDVRGRVFVALQMLQELKRLPARAEVESSLLEVWSYETRAAKGEQSAAAVRATWVSPARASHPAAAETPGAAADRAAAARAVDPERHRASPDTVIPEGRTDDAGTVRRGSLLPAPQSRALRPWLMDLQPSAHGGLLLLLNALEALDFARWLDLQSERVSAVFGTALLRDIASRTGVPEDDPQLSLLTLDESDWRRLAAEHVEWRDFAWPTWWTGAQPEGSAAVGPAIRVWRTALRRALRLHGRIGIGSVVRRPAAIAITPTHVDVVFPLKAVDLRLRRAGLDANPGWVTWFRRIVTVHFVDAEPYETRSDG